MGNHQTNNAVHAAGATPAGDAFKTGNRFTGVLGGRLSGEHLTPGIILTGKNVSRIAQSGHDYFGKNHNEMFPGIKGGACWFATDKGGMEDETLRSFIEAVVLPCVKDDPPTQANPIVLLLDGHKTRFSIVVLEGCRANHVIIFLGVPNSTHVWQFSDSSALNGGFKVFWSSAKVRYLMELPFSSTSLTRAPHPLHSLSQRKWIRMKCAAKEAVISSAQRVKIQTSDIAVLLNEVLPLTFGNESKRKGVIKRQGLFPFTRALLSHPEVLEGEAAKTKEHVERLDLSILMFNGNVNVGVLGDLTSLRTNRKEAQEVQKMKRESNKLFMGRELGADVTNANPTEGVNVKFLSTAGQFVKQGYYNMTGDKVFAEVTGRLEAQKRKTETVATNKAQRLDNKRVADEEKKAKEIQKNKKRKEKEAADVSFASATVRKPGSNRVDHAKTAKELAKGEWRAEAGYARTGFTNCKTARAVATGCVHSSCRCRS
jgi:hypothetical protein